MRIVIPSLSAVLLILVVAFPIEAALFEVLDQSHTTDELASYGCPSDREVGQVFTVGVDGILSKVELEMARGQYNPGGVTFRLYSVDASMPDQELVSESFAGNEMPAFSPPDGYDWIEWDVSGQNISVSEGDQLAVAIRPDTDGHYYLRSSYNIHTYDRGHNVHRGDFNGWQWDYSSGNYDLAFKSCVLVPEPSTAILLAIGSLGLAAAGRRRRRV